MIRILRNATSNASRYRARYWAQRQQHFSLAATTNDGYQWSNLYDEAHTMMMASYLSYPVTFILREALKGNLTKPADLLKKLSLIRDGDLDTALTPAELVDIIKANADFIESNYVESNGNMNNQFGWMQCLEEYQKMAEAGKAGADIDDLQTNRNISILEFDDFDDAHRLVFAVAVNRISKRIVIIFRGTYNEDTDDWKRNLQFDRVEVPLPAALRTDQNNSIYLHRGCYEYLFQNDERDPSYPQERYEEIVDVILKACQMFPPYKIFVSGHSLGGALGLLVAFHIAADDRIPKPVTCVSIGSLLVGDVSFQKAFGKLEQKGWIRHLRITNEKDPVPCLPPFGWFKPVGIHLELFQAGGHRLSHSTTSSTSNPDANATNSWSRLWETVRGSESFEDMVNPHTLPEYLKRLEGERQILENTKLNDCYNFKSEDDDNVRGNNSLTSV